MLNVIIVLTGPVLSNTKMTKWKVLLLLREKVWNICVFDKYFILLTSSVVKYTNTDMAVDKNNITAPFSTPWTANGK